MLGYLVAVLHSAPSDWKRTSWCRSPWRHGSCGIPAAKSSASTPCRREKNVLALTLTHLSPTLTLTLTITLTLTLTLPQPSPSPSLLPLTLTLIQPLGD